MRYFETAFYTNSEQIKENAKVNIREYAFNNPIAAVNGFVYRNLKNGIIFLLYREDNEESVQATFAFNERKYKLQDVCDTIFETLNSFFGIKQIKTEPCEITTFRFSENLLEAKRREFTQGGCSCGQIWEATNLTTLFPYHINKIENSSFEITENIVSVDSKKSTFMYDKSFQQELKNIEINKNVSDFCGNMVHYIISARSTAAITDMTETLVQALYNANRIESRRIEYISDISNELYFKSNHFEEIIENNYGGTVVIDLTVRLGNAPVRYQTTCEYIEKVLKKYKNQCLFIFTYNVNSTGFSYLLLPFLKKYVLPISLKEGVLDRKTAVRYLKELINNSEYSAYTNQTSEFFKQYFGNKFTQTDILKAFEQFETWCLSKKIFKGYDYVLTDDFMLDRDADEGSSYNKLQKLIGLGLVKKQIENIIATNLVERERKERRKNTYRTEGMHMIFAGNPGTAKTTVAKLFGSIAKEKGILKSGAFVECGGMDLDDLCCDMVIRDMFTAAKGGVLFIDEAYSMRSQTAIAVLLQEMENCREEVVVILAGYSERMEEFIGLNEGLKSRIPYWVDFPDYDANELTDIFKLMLREKGLDVTEEGVAEANYIFEKARFSENFGNGRYVRNLIENAIQKQSARLLKNKENPHEIKNKELFLITKDDICTLDEGLLEERLSGTAKREFNEMIGLTGAKSIIEKAIANFKLKKLCLDKGITKENVSLHMVFTGNPGTAKTTVARLFAEIMKDEKVLPTGSFIEVGRADLVGDHVGATAKLVKKRFKEATGGVLFIDEAYSLCDGYENSFGDEAITTIVQEMENNRDKVIVIFAGYPKQMKQFLSRNPGLLSRIAFHVEFEDYTTDELCEITRLMLSKKHMSITDKAMDKLRKHYESVVSQTDYGNGRFVRKLLEEAEMNLANRIFEFDESQITEETITTLQESDIPEVRKKEGTKKITIGFTATDK